jgi:hypothetical protein
MAPDRDPLKIYRRFDDADHCAAPHVGMLEVDAAVANRNLAE